MSYLRESKTTLRRQLTQEAINLAMLGRWEEAAAVNREIIENFPTDAEAFNRLGRALMELGRYAQAREAYQQALELDPYNAIAKKNLSRLSLLQEEETRAAQPERHRMSPQLFLGETGKAGWTRLRRVAPREVLARLVAGDEVSLQVEGQRLIVAAPPGTYLGEVEPRLARRLIRLTSGGNRYAAAVASVGEGELKVIIQETYQHPSQRGQLSFPPREAEPLRSLEMPYGEEEEMLPLDEGDEEPLVGAPAKETGEESAGDDWETTGAQ